MASSNRKLPSEVYKPQFAACRDVGHEWDYFEWYGSKRTLICANCNARRIERLDGNYQITYRRYVMPKGYAWKDTSIPVKRLRAQLKREARKLQRWVGPNARQHLKVLEGGRKEG